MVGGTRIPYSKGGTEYPRGGGGGGGLPRIYGMEVSNFLGCQIYCDTG